MRVKPSNKVAKSLLSFSSVWKIGENLGTFFPLIARVEKMIVEHAHCGSEQQE